MLLACVQIIEAYSTGVQAFKGLKERYGLTEESIEDTMLQIQEVCLLLKHFI